MVLRLCLAYFLKNVYAITEEVWASPIIQTLRSLLESGPITIYAHTKVAVARCQNA